MKRRGKTEDFKMLRPRQPSISQPLYGKGLKQLRNCWLQCGKRKPRLRQAKSEKEREDRRLLDAQAKAGVSVSTAKGS